MVRPAHQSLLVSPVFVSCAPSPSTCVPVVWNYTTNSFTIPHTPLLPLVINTKTRDMFLSFLRLTVGQSGGPESPVYEAQAWVLVVVNGAAVFSNIIWCKQQILQHFFSSATFRLFSFTWPSQWRLAPTFPWLRTCYCHQSPPPASSSTTVLTDLPHVLYNTSHHHTPRTPDCRTQPDTRTDTFHSLEISEELPVTSPALLTIPIPVVLCLVITKLSPICL